VNERERIRRNNKTVNERERIKTKYKTERMREKEKGRNNEREIIRQKDRVRKN
jgi:hypothetical protein